jgi:hypothetical protein
MKLIRAVMLAAVVSQATASTMSYAAPVPYAQVDAAKAERAALLLSTRARDVKAQVDALAGTGNFNANLSKAERLARQINLNALEIASLIRSDAPEADVLEVLQTTEDLVLQLDATKRALQRAYRYQFDITDFNNVRTAFYELKIVLTGDL